MRLRHSVGGRTSARRTGPGRDDRVDLDYLFVLTYGRSGSTLLQGILNTIPGYLIRGENRQLLRHLWRYDLEAREERDFQRGLRLKHRQLATRPTNSFYGIDGYPVATARQGLRQLAVDTLLRPDPDTRVTGFKEIRWEDDDIGEYVAWLREVFPGARFVVNTRNLDDVARSMWWAERPDAREHLESVEHRILGVAADLGPAAYRVHYDDYVADPGHLAGLYRWLDAPWDLEVAVRTMGSRHSY